MATKFSKPGVAMTISAIVSGGFIALLSLQAIAKIKIKTINPILVIKLNFSLFFICFSFLQKIKHQTNKLIKLFNFFF